MRFVKVFALIVIFFISMLFFIQNNEVLSQAMSLELSVIFQTWRSVPLPMYFLILVAFAVGSLFTLLFFLADKLKAAKQLRECRSRVASLEQEVTSLRNMPLEDRGLAVGPASDDRAEPEVE